MAGDTWVALDGRDSQSYTATVWISDVGPYTGPNPATLLGGSSWIPSDSSEVDYLIVPPNPDGHDDHVLGSGTWAYTVGDNYQQWYFTDGSPPNSTGNPSTLDSGAHLFVVFFVDGFDPVGDPATLPTPSMSPLDLTPVGWASGGRLSFTPPGFQFGGLELAIDTTPHAAEGAIGFAFGGMTLTATSGRPAMALYDESGQWLTNLPNASGITWQHELSAPGSLTCRLPLDDPATAQATARRILKVYWRGRARMAARINGSGVDLAVDGRAWREFSNLPGVLAMLADANTYPETALYAAADTQRTFGFMSVEGPWYVPDDWVTPIGVRWSAETDVKAGRPAGLDYPDPSWIAKNGPHHVEATGATQYFRRTFTTTASTLRYQILATADNQLTLYLDGERLITPDMQQGLTWTQLLQVTGVLDPGEHLLAAKVTNDRPRPGHPYNPLSLILTLQQLQPNGDVVLGTPIVNSDETWLVSNASVGFRRADILLTLWAEALARGVKAVQVLTLGFDHDHDSRGQAWTDAPKEYTAEVNTSLLDVAATMTEADMDLDVDFDTLTVNGFNQAGQDLSATVHLLLGKDGGALVSHHVDRAEMKFNVVLAQKADGTYAEFIDAAASADYRMESGLSLGSTTEDQTAEELAAGALAEGAGTQYSFTTRVSPLAGPQAYVDYGVGDIVSVPDDAGVLVPVRVMALTVDASTEVPSVTPELVALSASGVVDSPAPTPTGDVPGTDSGGSVPGPGPGGGEGTGVGSPPDVTTFSDFTFVHGTVGKLLTDVVAGAGIDTTMYEMVPHTSTKAGSVPVPTSSNPNPTNPLYLLWVGGQSSSSVPSDIDLGGFTLHATDQGHLYNGLMVAYSNGAHIHDLFIKGVPGNDNEPPGETFPLNLWHANNALVEHVTIDGTNDAGTRVSASNIGLNNATGITVRNCKSNYAAYGMGLTGYKCSDITVQDCDLRNNRRPLNFERCGGGFIHITRCDLRGMGHRPHITVNSDQSSAIVVITDPVVDAWPLRVGVSSHGYLGHPQRQRVSDVTLIVGGVNQTHNPAYLLCGDVW